MTTHPDSAQRLPALLSERESDILDSWLDITAAQLRGRAARGELKQDQRELFDAVRAGLASGEVSDVDAAGFDVARAVLTELSHARARQGFSPTETSVAVFALKEAVLGVLDQHDPHALADFIGFSKLVDQLGLFTFETFNAAREQILVDQAAQLLELSTPVVKLWEGVVAVPLVGTLDSARTQVFMEKLLQTLVDTGSEHAIIDITGVPAVDTAGRAAPSEDGRRSPADGCRVHHQRHPAADRADDRRARDRVRRHPDEGDPRRRSRCGTADTGMKWCGRGKPTDGPLPILKIGDYCSSRSRST